MQTILSLTYSQCTTGNYVIFQPYYTSKYHRYSNINTTWAKVLFYSLSLSHTNSLEAIFSNILSIRFTIGQVENNLVNPLVVCGYLCSTVRSKFIQCQILEILAIVPVYVGRLYDALCKIIGLLKPLL